MVILRLFESPRDNHEWHDQIWLDSDEAQVGQSTRKLEDIRTVDKTMVLHITVNSLYFSDIWFNMVCTYRLLFPSLIPLSTKKWTRQLSFVARCHVSDPRTTGRSLIIPGLMCYECETSIAGSQTKVVKMHVCETYPRNMNSRFTWYMMQSVGWLAGFV